MAAGRVDVSRRDVDNFSGKSRSNGSCRADSIRGRSHGYPFSSNVRKLDHRGWLASDNDAKDPRSLEKEERVLSPPQKKRKFSPITWDLEDLKVSSVNKALANSNVLQPRSSTAVNVSAVSNLSKHPVTNKSMAIPYEPFVDTLSVPTEHTRDDEPEEGEVAHEEFFQARNVSMSRWASESPDLEKEGSGVESDCLVGSASDNVYSQNDSCNDIDDESSAGNCQMDVESDDDVNFNLVEETKLPIARSINMLQGCRSISEFEKLNRISEGTYGIVYRAREKKTGEIVALKMVKNGLERDGFPLSALREINILLSFNHPSIVGVKEVVMDDHDNVFVVMEYMEHDLKWLMSVMKQPFSVSEVKCLMLQLLEGVNFLHDNWVLHRDLKTSNLLVNNNGELKICDFGMSRQYGSPLKPYTPLVVTLWYRAPEILLGTKQYSTAVDMWSVGCIMAELLAKEPLFQGQREIDQLDKIFKVLGTPNETIWPGFSELPGVKPSFNKQPFNLLRKKFPAVSFTGSPVLSDLGFDLLSRLLTYDPEKRITAEEALNHDWFQEVPRPKSKEFMPTFPARHIK